mmetsp:Transcript_24450/g.61477  ORF Transcript_24450/g.61477 Transcript_24450/m.61477 type:complete len:1028 (-) Transcript_24450:430-3513(-)|eukprot:CAMPEP_0178993454 /NCGR_PEP_ID=MMETSP0795-20121207/6711_1 /TAXON_ID=88552 /ORGANISM="Amoebophrya sp., Strain Ameob2" /LENGTH=1027 /DNA_ID=CAMNT_0020685513 /DNA_START=106 /DNA_END=3189 /DNA_ORIENTATION=+
MSARSNPLSSPRTASPKGSSPRSALSSDRSGPRTPGGGGGNKLRGLMTLHGHAAAGVGSNSKETAPAPPVPSVLDNTDHDVVYERGVLKTLVNTDPAAGGANKAKKPKRDRAKDSRDNSARTGSAGSAATSAKGGKHGTIEEKRELERKRKKKQAQIVSKRAAILADVAQTSKGQMEAASQLALGSRRSPEDGRKSAVEPERKSVVPALRLPPRDSGRTTVASLVHDEPAAEPPSTGSLWGNVRWLFGLSSSGAASHEHHDHDDEDQDDHDSNSSSASTEEEIYEALMHRDIHAVEQKRRLERSRRRTPGDGSGTTGKVTIASATTAASFSSTHDHHMHMHTSKKMKSKDSKHTSASSKSSRPPRQESGTSSDNVFDESSLSTDDLAEFRTLYGGAASSGRQDRDGTRTSSRMKKNKCCWSECLGRASLGRVTVVRVLRGFGIYNLLAIAFCDLMIFLAPNSPEFQKDDDMESSSSRGTVVRKPTCCCWTEEKYDGDGGEQGLLRGRTDDGTGGREQASGAGERVAGAGLSSFLEDQEEDGDWQGRVAWRREDGAAASHAASSSLAGGNGINPAHRRAFSTPSCEEREECEECREQERPTQKMGARTSSSTTIKARRAASSSMSTTDDRKSAVAVSAIADVSFLEEASTSSTEQGEMEASRSSDGAPPVVQIQSYEDDDDLFSSSDISVPDEENGVEQRPPSGSPPSGRFTQMDQEGADPHQEQKKTTQKGAEARKSPIAVAFSDYIDRLSTFVRFLPACRIFTGHSCYVPNLSDKTKGIAGQTPVAAADCVLGPLRVASYLVPQAALSIMAALSFCEWARATNYLSAWHPLSSDNVLSLYLPFNVFQSCVAFAIAGKLFAFLFATLQTDMIEKEGQNYPHGAALQDIKRHIELTNQMISGAWMFVTSSVIQGLFLGYLMTCLATEKFRSWELAPETSDSAADDRSERDDDVEKSTTTTEASASLRGTRSRNRSGSSGSALYVANEDNKMKESRKTLSIQSVNLNPEKPSSTLHQHAQIDIHAPSIK